MQKVIYKVAFPLILFFLILLTQISYWKLYNISLVGIYITLLLIYAVRVADYRYCLLYPLPRVIKIFSLFYLYALLSVIWSHDVFFTLVSSSLLLCALLSMFLGYYSPKKLSQIFLVIVIVFAVFLSLVSIYEVFILNAPRAVGLLDNWNTNAAFIVFALILLDSLYLNSDKKSYLVIGLGVALLVFVVSLTKSRGAFLSLTIALLFFAFLTFVYKYSWRRYFGVLFWSGFGLLAESVLRGGMLNRVLGSVSTQNVTSGRISLWESTIKLYLHEPFTGFGYGALWLILPSNRFLVDSTAVRSTHNDYLQILAELGPGGGLLFVIFVISVLILFRKVLARQSTQKHISLESAIWVALVGVMIHAFFTYHFYQLSMLFLVGFFTGYLLNRLVIKEEPFVIEDERKLYSGSFVYYMKLGLIGACLVWFTLNLISSVLLVKSKTEEDFVEAYAEAKYATFFAPWNSDAFQQRASLLYEQLKNTHSKNDERLLVAINLLQRSERFSSLDGDVYALKAGLMQMDLQRFNFHEVVEQYNMALKIMPYSLKNRVAYAHFLINNEKYIQANTVLYAGWGHYYQCDLNLIHRYLGLYKYVQDMSEKNTDQLTQLISRVVTAQKEKIACTGIYLNNSLLLNQ